MKQSLLVWSKRLFLTLLTLILTVIVLVALLLFTNIGLKTAIWGAGKAVPQLSIGQVEGALLPKFTLNDVQYRDDMLETQLQAVTLAISPQCLFEPKLCIEEVTLTGLTFALPELPPSNETPPPSEPLTEITTPIPVVIKRITLDDIDADVLGNKVKWQHFSTALSMEGGLLNIAPTFWKTVTVALAPAQTKPQAAPSSSASAPTNKAPIELPTVQIPLEIHLAQFELSDFTLQQETPVEIHQLEVQAQVGGHEVNVQRFTLDMPQLTAALSTQVTLKDDYPISLDLDAQLNETELKGQKVTLAARGSVANLALTGQLENKVEATLKAQLQPLQPELPFDVEIKRGRVKWPLTGKSDYQVALDHLDAHGSIHQYHFDLATQVKGQQIPELDITMAASGTLEEIQIKSVNVETLGGALQGKVTAGWKEQVKWQAELALNHIQPGLQWPEAEGDISGRLITAGRLTQQGGWQVELPQLNIDGVLRGHPLNVEGQLQAEDLQGKGEFKVVTQGLALSHGPNRIQALGQLDREWNMDLFVDFPDFGKSVPDLTGSMKGDIELRGDFKAPQASLDLSLSRVAWQDLAQVRSLTLRGDVTPLPKPQADLSVKASKIKYQDHHIDQVALSLRGSETQHQLSFELFSDLITTELAIEGQLQQQPAIVWQGALSRMYVTSEQGTWTLANPMGITADANAQTALIKAHCWRQEEAQLCLTQDMLAGQSGEAHLALEQFNFAQVKQYVPEPTQVEGEANATIWAKWSPNEPPQAKVALTMPKGKVTQQGDTPIALGWESVSLSANVAQGQLDANWLVDVTDNGDLSGSVSIPDVQAKEPVLDARLALGTFNLDFLAPLVGEFSLLQANLSTELHVTGSAMHPQVKGQLLVDNLALKGDITPIDINQGRIALDFNGYQAELDADVITPDGKLELVGDAGWQDLAKWHSNVRVFADELKVNMPPMVKIKLVPDMTINVTPNLAKIDGDLALPWGRIVVDELPPSAVGVSKDQVILDKELQPIEKNPPIPFEVETNINIRIGDDFKLAAFGLESGLQGKLNVTQKDQGPYIVGEVNLIEGTYRSLGQDLQIQQGKILMNGPADQPYVSIRAIRNPDNTQDDVIAGVKVTGPASEPKIDIFSEPAMAQQNALSYLLRGQNIDGESGGGSMTTTLIGLSLAKSGKIVGEIGEAFGVQDLQLDTQGSGDDSQVTVSGYVLPGLQVKYGIGIFDSLGEFTVRYRLMQDLYIEAISGLDSAVDLLYQFEFD